MDVESGVARGPLARDDDDSSDVRLQLSYTTDNMSQYDDTQMIVGGRQRIVALALFAAYMVSLCVVWMVSAQDHLALLGVFAVCTVMLCFAYLLTRAILGHATGPPEMLAVSNPIREGAEAFFHTQYAAIGKISVVVSAVLLCLYLLRPSSMGVPPVAMAVLVVVSFLFGCMCSAFAGFVGLWVAVRANIRVASAYVPAPRRAPAHARCSATESYNTAIQLALRGGACSGLLVVGTVTLGLASLFALLRVLSSPLGLTQAQVPHLMIGYTFGASFVALFSQLGGGIYTKAADVGADLVGKVEQGIPEDDPRNPSVIADLVGDNVGDCQARGADLFESIAAEILGAMIIGGQLATNANVDAAGFLFFPLAVHALDCVVSSVGVMIVSTSSNMNENDLNNFDGDASRAAAVLLEDPLSVLKRGFYVAMLLSALGTTGLCYFLLQVPSAPDAWWHFLLCAFVGMVSACINLLVAQYYTDYNYGPVREIAKAAETGDATVVIAGMSVGMRSTAVPVLTISCGLLTSYHLGQNGIEGGGLFGTAVATMGMLSTAVYVLSMDVFGPVTDNAGGIVEMSGQPERVRALTDKLDAAGNVVKAATKGYAVGSAGLAAFLLFSAFADVVTEAASEPFGVIDFSHPACFVGGLLGCGLVYLFTGLTMRAVGEAAGAVVLEVRRQFRERPGIMTGRELPDYGRCVRLVTEAALAEMTVPGMLVVLAPTVIGFTFKFVGLWTNEPLLGPTVVGAFLISTTISGIVMGVFLNNAGGAWDNAKKYVEMGYHGGRGSLAHKAVVTGDTVGDPFKDTSGPSLHVLLKLVCTCSLVMAPLWLNAK